MNWTAERIKRLLHASYDEGIPSGVLAKEFGVSKNAILGKLFRLRAAQAAIDTTPKQSASIPRTLRMRFQRHLLSPVGHPFVRALLVEMNSQQCTYADLSDRTGINKYTFSNWRYHQPKIGDLEAAFNALDMTMRPRRRSNEKLDRSED